MKSCTSCGQQCANGAGYCSCCLKRFTGEEPATIDSADERIGPYLLSGLVLLLSISVVSVAWWIIATSNFWDVIAQIWWKALS